MLPMLQLEKLARLRWLICCFLLQGGVELSQVSLATLSVSAPAFLVAQAIADEAAAPVRSFFVWHVERHREQWFCFQF